ncbi:MAG: MFS transporter [Sulfuricaulis sp.]|nr:MFS transporter [Sulfuricaulis sp.]
MSFPRYSKNPRIEQSLRHSVRDGVAYSFMAGAGETYFSAYALFLKATTAQISWLAALPSLLGSFAQLFSAWLASRTGQRKLIILLGVALQTAMWLPIVWLPYFFPANAVPILIVCVALYFSGGHLAAPMWNSLMGDLVPERRRGRFFARRGRLMSITMFAALAAAGLMLHFGKIGDHTRFAFSLIFSLAALARVYSAIQLARMHDPKPVPHPLDLPPLAGAWARMRASHFARFTIFLATMNFAVAIASPLFTVFMLRDLHFTYLQYMACTALAVLLQFLTLSMWGRLGDIFGNRLVMLVTGGIIPVFPVLWLVSTNYWYILALQAMGGVFWAGFSLSANNFLYDVSAPEQRAVFSAVHNVLSSLTIFAGALLGGFLSLVIPDQIILFGHAVVWTSSLWGVLLISTLARTVVALAFLPRLREVREVRKLTPAGLMLRVARFNAVTVLIFDTLALTRRRLRSSGPA